ncbi:ABC transporter ATP-binding protein [Desulfonatronovibrio hydrogenovorans]|uniref:ABC transporter ATP-binding protein n=1 Tax=Desulfonatronovibrio hydrogenovorans TaxID=53245 RepID=UPI00048F0329|nr:ABC transporter ATP-binding protein [Desulfonatronovibrio hydrogenovorans]
MTFISTKNLIKKYAGDEDGFPAVNDVTMDIEQGEFVAVMGRSGSGKSTLLSVLGALNTPTSGLCTVDSIDIYALGHDQQADFRREYLGFVFQNFHLLPYLTALENVMVPLAVTRFSYGEKKDMAMKALAQVNLEKKARQLPSMMSGGEQERVAIARAVVNHPRIILADEPTGNLDSKTGQEVMELLSKLNQQGITVVMVTHSRENSSFAGRVLTMTDGKLSG